MGESAPPIFPNIFIRPESDPENFRVRSLQVAHHEAVLKMLNPAAQARNKIANVLFAV